MPGVDVDAIDKEVDAQTAAALFAMSPQAFATLVKEGVVTPGKLGRFTIRRLAIDYTTYLKTRSRTAAADSARELNELKLEETKLKLAETKGTIFTKSGVLEFVQGKLGPLKVALLSIPARYTRDAKERKVLQGMIDDAFAGI